jgi:hypothetical protein
LGDTVLDPFCGSGTTLLEAQLLGRKAIGFDINPLAALISSVKTTEIDPELLLGWEYRLSQGNHRKANHTSETPELLNYWFKPYAIQELSRLLYTINQIDDSAIRDFFRLCFSQSLRHLSMADPRFYVPVRLRPDKYPQKHWFRDRARAHLARRPKHVREIFLRAVHLNIQRMSNFSEIANPKNKVHVAMADIRNHSGIPLPFKRRLAKDPARLIITSPPYGTAQKYVRCTSLNLAWLNNAGRDELRQIDKKTIGREHLAPRSDLRLQKTGIREADSILERVHKTNPVRARLMETYLCDMQTSFENSYKFLANDGYFVLIASANSLIGKIFPTHRYLVKMLEQIGFLLELHLIDNIFKHSMITKRNTTASTITQEHIYILKK